MDQFSIPNRLEPVAPAQPTRRQGSSSDERRRSQKPLPEQVPDDDNDDSPEGEDLHNVDELA
jgi:hypothetical protein